MEFPLPLMIRLWQRWQRWQRHLRGHASGHAATRGGRATGPRLAACSYARSVVAPARREVQRSRKDRHVVHDQGWDLDADDLELCMTLSVTDNPQPRVRVSARIPFQLFQQLEQHRFDLSRTEGRRVSSRTLLETALALFLEGRVSP